MDNFPRTNSGLCKHTLERLEKVYHSLFEQELADVTFAMDAFRAKQDIEEFFALKNAVERMSRYYEDKRLFQTHNKD